MKLFAQFEEHGLNLLQILRKLKSQCHRQLERINLSKDEIGLIHDKAPLVQSAYYRAEPIATQTFALKIYFLLSKLVIESRTTR